MLYEVITLAPHDGDQVALDAVLDGRVAVVTGGDQRVERRDVRDRAVAVKRRRLAALVQVCSCVFAVV